MSDPEPTSTGTTRGFTIALTITVLMLVAGATVAIGAITMGGAHPADQVRVAPGGEISLDSMSPDIAAHYAFAAEHRSTYAHVPCFCGCDATLEHRSLLDCFVRPDGGWERHAAGCAVCTQESSAVRSMLADGEGAHAIRLAVIDTYTM